MDLGEEIPDCLDVSLPFLKKSSSFKVDLVALTLTVRTSVVPTMSVLKTTMASLYMNWKMNLTVSLR